MSEVYDTPGQWEVLLDAKGTSGDLKLEQAMLNALCEAFELWCKKQRDYGSSNIAQAGEAGVVLRANDKVQRLRTLQRVPTSIPTPLPANEPRRDSWLDLINYAAMGLLLHDGKWPKGVTIDETHCSKCGLELPWKRREQEIK